MYLVRAIVSAGKPRVILSMHNYYETYCHAHGLWANSNHLTFQCVQYFYFAFEHNTLPDN